jgi:cyclic pyranopterin monophosphate synthase
MVEDLTHFDKKGQAHIVDIAFKDITKRTAKCAGYISMQKKTLQMIKNNSFKKGDVLSVARIAGIMATKQTSSLIPLCHPIPIEHISIDFNIFEDENKISCNVQIDTTAKTGIEMEALCAVQICLLTIYDMCKAVDRSMIISDIKLLEKHGGKSGSYIRD